MMECTTWRQAIANTQQAFPRGTQHLHTNPKGALISHHGQQRSLLYWSFILVQPTGNWDPAMSLWARVQHLEGDVIKRIQSQYGQHFPIEVRHYCAQWLEEQPWSQIEEDNPAHEVYAHQVLSDLIKAIQIRKDEFPSSNENFLQKMKLQETANKLQTLYSNSPLLLVKEIKSCLAQEERFVHQAENPVQNQDTMNDQLKSTEIYKQIDERFDRCQEKTQTTEAGLKQLQNLQESFVIQFQNQVKVNAQIQQVEKQNKDLNLYTNGADGGPLAESMTPQQYQQLIKNSGQMEKNLRKQKEDLERDLLSKAEELLQYRLILAEKLSDTFLGLEELQKIVVDKALIAWKRRQQLSGNGVKFDTQLLDNLQQWCESLAEMIWKNRQQVLGVEILRQMLPIDIPAGTPDLVPELNQKITGLLSSLVTSTFIVESQPPQVLKKGLRFTATVRLLVGGKLNIHMSPPTVKSFIISEEQAIALLKNDTHAKSDTSGEILNNNGTMEYHQAKGELSITFRNMSLKKIKRADKKGSEAVTEEKFCVLFQSDFQIGNGELMFQVWTLSLPVVVTVHGNQECNAMATVLWDNQFAEPGRTPFAVPDSVPWCQMAELLNGMFQAATGRGLTADNLSYLANKAFGGQIKPGEDFSQRLISWPMFNKDALSARNFTFWEWFYNVMKLTEEHLKSPWMDGSVIGFISKNSAQEWLMTKPNGTFLLRFSDSETGGITIAWVADDPSKTGERSVWNLAPYGRKDFIIRSLSDRIKDLDALVTLYPNISKSQAFGKYYTAVSEKHNEVKDGYVQSTLVARLPDSLANAAPIDFNNPQTPQGLHLSPDSPVYEPNSVGMAQNHLQPIDEDMDDSGAFDPSLLLSATMTDYSPDDINDIDDINIVEFLKSISQKK
ncbi:signal transducer and activator of transcription 5B-like [Mizuhopecten yessoensis]|uniref:signal transducer and activator of transcription 5B-like n=1 Tax=Mizuhopecten yessoensis TaxID=6573 RepID=UPI000B4584A9|nr:signal transducer and activator of transcription 5B-like [Mizuhopecten yessoensis]